VKFLLPLYSQRGLLIGAETAYNLRESKLIRYNLGVGYNTPEYSLALQAYALY